jgi:hypothetical protein
MKIYEPAAAILLERLPGPRAAQPPALYVEDQEDP